MISFIRTLMTGFCGGNDWEWDPEISARVPNDIIAPFHSQNYWFSSFLSTFWIFNDRNHHTIIPLAFVNQLSQTAGQGQITDLYRILKKLVNWEQLSDREIRSNDFSEKWQADWPDSLEEITL
jgi:hypothetical protein